MIQVYSEFKNVLINIKIICLSEFDYKVKTYLTCVTILYSKLLHEWPTNRFFNYNFSCVYLSAIYVQCVVGFLNSSVIGWMRYFSNISYAVLFFGLLMLFKFLQLFTFILMVNLSLLDSNSVMYGFYCRLF